MKIKNQDTHKSWGPLTKVFFENCRYYEKDISKMNESINIMLKTEITDNFVLLQLLSIPLWLSQSDWLTELRTGRKSRTKLIPPWTNYALSTELNRFTVVLTIHSNCLTLNLIRTPEMKCWISLIRINRAWTGVKRFVFQETSIW